MSQGVRAWEEQVMIPTYEVGKPDKNPMFLEKRVYQGSSGKVYPYPVIDKIEDEKIEKAYQVVYLENDYIQVMIMPELGGRIQRALDKTNQYDFVYYNQVIKPALVGLVGPWISGGIEFNWPQHHRPNTYGPVDYTIKENPDGSVTVWVSEVDRMYGTKGMAGFTLYPDRAYIEIKGQLYNRTDTHQTFLWWANPAVAAHDQTQSIFPPDVHAVMDHGKRDVSTFPIATGTYYKMDYSKGVDISKYKNIPVPTSYMAYHSDYNFVGGYDHSVQAGLLHVANHHIAPGKKQWTWGNGSFGQAWDRQLTDSDGPYIELMTGVYTDNQPDFTWMVPGEEKAFTQYFMPYKGIGYVKQASKELALSMEVTSGVATIGLYASTAMKEGRIQLVGNQGVYIDQVLSLNPATHWIREVSVGSEKQEALTLRIISESGKVLLSYTPIGTEKEEVPSKAEAIGLPETLKNTEALYLAGKHLEQYRHATYEPEDYYKEGLRRDAEDIRLNTAYGSLLLRRGLFEESTHYFKQAIQTATRHSPNPYDGEAHYLLGLSLSYGGHYEAAYAAFYKSTWNGAYQQAGYYQIARLDMIKGNLDEALVHIEQSLIRNTHSINARHLKGIILRRLGRYEEALQLAKETYDIDPLDALASYEVQLLAQVIEVPGEVLGKGRCREEIQSSLLVARAYIGAGQYQEASMHLENKNNPLAFYYRGYCMYQLGDYVAGHRLYEQGEQAVPDYCFPNDLMDIVVLEHVQANRQKAGMAAYYLGNLWYDRKQVDRAVKGWKACCACYPNFATAYRNLSLAYYNVYHEQEKACTYLEKAFALNPKDARVLLELDQLYKRLNKGVDIRLAYLSQYKELVTSRDDLYIEYITLLNENGQYQEARECLAHRLFHPWEGGEGKVTRQYVRAQIGCAKMCVVKGAYQEAIGLLEEGLIYPEHLGEGKLAGSTDNELYFVLGTCYQAKGAAREAEKCFRLATKGQGTLADAMYYNDQPPENIFFQGRAYEALGRVEVAKEKFNQLINYGKCHMEDEMIIDYFAVSLPDFLIFEEDFSQRSQAHCYYLLALGEWGLGKKEAARKYFKQVLALDTAHQQAIESLRDL